MRLLVGVIRWFLGLLLPGLGSFWSGRLGFALLWASGAPLVLALPPAAVVSGWLSPDYLLAATAVCLVGWRLLASFEGLRPGVPAPRLAAWDLRVAFVCGSVLWWALGRSVAGALFAESDVVFTLEMAPTLLPGDSVLVRRGLLSAPLERGAVVAWRASESAAPQFARVIAAPGERIDEDRGLRLDGAPVSAEPLGPWTLNDLRCVPVEGVLVVEGHGARRWPTFRELVRAVTASPVTVPADAWFLLGDARESAVDSRVVGWVPGSRIIGVVSHVWRSVDPCTGEARPLRPGPLPRIEAALLGG